MCLHYCVDKPTFNYKGIIVIVFLNSIIGYVSDYRKMTQQSSESIMYIM